MKLPKLDLPKTKHKLIGLNKDIHFRPFTLKEQKILLLAKETGGEREQIEAIKQIIELCTFGDVDPNELPYFDMEDLFLRIRAKSVGEICEIYYKDKLNPEDKIKVSINLNDVKVQVDPEHNKKIMLSDDIGIMMKYPTLGMISSKDDLTKLSDDEIIRDCIDYVFDKDNVYYFKDLPKEEVDEWIEDLGTESLTKIQQFFITAPRIKHEIKVKLRGDREETLKFEGIESFFV